MARKCFTTVLLIVLVIFLHIFIILGCVFGDKLYTKYIIKTLDSAKAKLKTKTRKTDPFDNYICIEERIFPYCMAFMIIFLTIFLLGLAKGLIGLICSRRVGMFGLDLLLDLPHPINCYYEPELRCEEVVYDCQGWPIHPITHQRTRIINESSELCINSVFFFAFPFFVAWVALQNALGCYESSSGDKQHKKPKPEAHYDTVECPEVPKEKRYKACQPVDSITLYDSCNRCNNQLDIYDDDECEVNDTNYVLDQMCKSEEKLNQCEEAPVHKHNKSYKVFGKHNRNK